MDTLEAINPLEYIMPHDPVPQRILNASRWFVVEVLELDFGDYVGRPHPQALVRVQLLSYLFANGWYVDAVSEGYENGEWISVGRTDTQNTNSSSGYTQAQSSSHSATQGQSVSATQGQSMSATQGQNTSATQGQNTSATQGQNTSATQGQNTSAGVAMGKSTSQSESGSSLSGGGMTIDNHSQMYDSTAAAISNGSVESQTSETTQTSSQTSTQTSSQTSTQTFSQASTQTSSQTSTQTSSQTSTQTSSQTSSQTLSQTSTNSSSQASSNSVTENEGPYWYAFVRLRLKRRKLQAELVMKDMVEDLTKAYNEGRKVNDERYDELVNLYALMLGRTEDEGNGFILATADFKPLTDYVLGTMKRTVDDFHAVVDNLPDDVFKNRVREINLKFDNQLSKARVEMITAGLFNSTVWTTTASGIERNREMALNDLIESKIDVYVKVAGASGELGQKFTDAAARLQQMAKDRLLDPAKLRNEVFKWMLDFMERRKDEFPGLDQIAGAAKQLGYAETTTSNGVR